MSRTLPLIEQILNKYKNIGPAWPLFLYFLFNAGSDYTIKTAYSDLSNKSGGTPKMNAEILQNIFYSKGAGKAKQHLFTSFNKDKITDIQFVDLSILLGQLIIGKVAMVCDIKKKEEK